MDEDSTDCGAGETLRSRRRFLAVTAAGVAGVAGCSTDTGSSGGDGADGSSAGGDGTDGGDGATSEGDTDGSDGTPTDATPTDSAVGRPLEEWSEYDPEWEAPTTSPLAATLEAEVLVENLEVPWDIAFTPDGDMFLTERVGRVLRLDGDEVKTVAEPTEAIDAGSLEPGSDERPWWVKGGEGGTLGIAVHPSYPDPSQIFVYYTYTNGDGEKYNKVSAFDVDSDEPGTPVETVVDEIPANNYHNGGRVAFGPRNYLWVTCGDGGQPEAAQDPGSLAGKILRVTPSGEPAPDNPDIGDDADPRVFTYGHRNPQGIVWLPDATPVISEHGPGGRDEVNRLEAGADYGFEEVRKREEYLGEPSVHRPLWNTGGTSVAPTGSLFYTGDAAPSLAGRMLTGGLIGQRLMATTITPAGEELPPAEDGTRYDQDWTDDGYVATRHDFFENEVGRIRHVEQGPDGALYLITSNRDNRAREGFPKEYDDILARITPG